MAQEVTFDQLMAMIQGLAVSAEHTRQAVLAHVESRGGGNASQEVKIDSRTFPNLELKGTEVDLFESFFEWELKVKRIVASNPKMGLLPMGVLGSGILGCLSGPAQRRTLAVEPHRSANLGQFMDHLRELFCGGAVAEKARAMFL